MVDNSSGAGSSGSMPAGSGIMALQGAGALMSAYGSWQAGNANAAIDRMNAEFDRTKAAQSLEKGEYQAGVMDIRESQVAGAQAASFAGQGVVAGAGSAGSVVTAGAATAEANKDMTRLNARREAYGFQVAAANMDFQADLAHRQGNMAALSGILGGAGQMAFTGAILGG